MKEFSYLFFAFCLISSFHFSDAVFMNTQNCNPDNCQLPNCYCPSFSIPGNLPLAQTPQFIFFTFDDSMYEADFNRMSNYSWILNNPNITDSLGCPLKLSWYALEICTYIKIENFLKIFLKSF